MNNMKKWNFVVSGVIFAIGIAAIVLASQFPITWGTGDPGSGVWPMGLGIILTGLAIILFINTLVCGSKLAEQVLILSQAKHIKVYIMMGVVVGYLVLFRIFGFYIATALFVPVTMLVLGERRWMRILITDGATVLGVYVLFDLLLNTQFPAPFFLS